MKKRLFASLTALCLSASTMLSLAASAEKEYYFFVDHYRFRGFIVETDGTELTKEMLPSSFDSQYMGLYNWTEFTKTTNWGYNEVDYTPSDSTYILQLRSYEKDYLDSYSRELMLELDCVENVYYFGYKEYCEGGIEWEYADMFYAEMTDPSLNPEELDIPELEGYSFEKSQVTEAYVFGMKGEDSQLYLDAEAAIKAEYGLETVNMVNGKEIFEYLDNFATALEEKYPEYFKFVRVNFLTVESPNDAPSVITSTVSAWQTAGDHNADGEVNSNDAADLLVQAAQDGVAEASETAVSPDSDVNLDGVADSTDAAYILQYAALKGSGADADWVEILKK